MTESTTESELPLYNHTARKDWGVAVLVREEAGKRAYLFEDGEERTMASGYHQLMRRVEQPSVDQRAFYERQRAVLARREKASSSGSPSDGRSFLDQLDTLHDSYTAGILDAKWTAEVRGEGAADRAPRHRDALVKEAKERLSPSAIEPLIKSQSYAQVWEAVLAVLSHTDLVPAAQLKKPRGVKDDAMKALALAVRELLHGTAAYDQRFEGFLSAFNTAYGEGARWELATAVIAVYAPNEHIVVHPAAFKQQVKIMGGRGSAPARASAAGYTRFLSVARLVFNKLREQNQEPRDLLDVYDFIRLTSGAAPKGRVVAKPRAKAVAAAPAADDSDSDSDDSDE
ncbi:MAG TPA: hypothetical protein VHP33_33910 [Polyangiaceae bacterium]|nr:hypothetical protein [Polyangiaceae bacterium]